MLRRIVSVLPGSPASRHRISPGDILLRINEEPVLDEIDYQALTARRYVKLTLSNPEGEVRDVKLVKPLETALGLQFDDSLIGNPRTCGNNCVFCFVQQMPQGLRPSLYLKDDDWRLSLLMGNYITLTNVGPNEFERIIRRRASPLYISVHATDMALREQMMGNRHASGLMERLQRLKDEGLSFHSQLVLCPGLNDGPVLRRSLHDLLALAPAALSVAVVPVGLTRHREGLPPIRPYTQEEALEVLAICTAFQETALENIGTRFAFAADEFYSLAGSPIPPDEAYESYAQLENGVGMLRRFETELAAAALEAAPAKPAAAQFRVLLPCGTALAPYLAGWLDRYLPSHIEAEIVPIRNDFFGETVTVSGLIVGQDLIAQLAGRQADAVLICETMLNSERAVFLDDLRPQDVAERLGIPVRVFPNQGGAFLSALNALGCTEPKDEKPT